MSKDLNLHLHKKKVSKITGTPSQRSSIISEHIESFLKKGGEIKKVDIGISGSNPDKGVIQIHLSEKNRFLNKDD